MKRKVAGVLAALLILVLGTTTVFATGTGAGSPGAEEAKALQEALDLANKATNATGRTANGTDVTVSRAAATTSEVSEAKKLAEEKASGATVLAVVDLTTSADPSVIAAGISVTISVAVKQTDNVYVMHKLSDGTWETLKPSAVGDGYVVVTLKSFSPVSVVVYPAGVNLETTEPSTGSGSGSSTATETNTNTNDNSSSGGTQTNSQTNSQTDTQTNSQTNSQSQNNNNNQSNNQSNDNNQSNSQTNNQNNPVNVEQNVTVEYPDYEGRYGDGYEDGYADGYNASKGTNKGTSGGTGGSGGSGAVATAPKTGASLPALPFAAMFAAAGLTVCGRKARKGN